MPHPSRIYPRDEELGKRDDNYRPSKNASANWHWRAPLRWRKRRLAAGALGLFLVWLFIHNIPTDLGTIDERMGHALRPGHTVSGRGFGYAPAQDKGPNGMPMGAPPRTKDDGYGGTTEEEHYFSGPIKFYKLARSLHGIARTMGYRQQNRNVLFAASSLKSAANLIPMACEMARWDRNYVHLALLGREAMSLEDVLDVNGIDTKTCTVFFHDGRPDYSEYSTDIRAEISVAGAMNHIDKFMHPQVIITDDSAVEDVFFVRGMRSKAKALERPIIEVPKGKYEDLLWMSRLDSGSLASWHKPNINILIHAPPESAGSLIRSVKSLEKADYAGLTAPRLTIELPFHIDPFERRYLQELEWPPNGDSLVPHTSTLTLQHRVAPGKATTESNAVRLLESFYPSSSSDSHVLLLSTQTELSPLYYHFLQYLILEYRYASYGPGDHEALFGIALATPATYLNGSAPFTPPSIKDMGSDRYAKSAKDAIPDQPVPFLWQAPNADAALIFGDKWAELHDYLSNRLRVSHERSAHAPEKRKKEVAEDQPGWMEYVLELMRARAWSLLYPAPGDAGSWATVHQDLYQPPEEFSMPARNPSAEDDDDAALPARRDDDVGETNLERGKAGGDATHAAAAAAPPLRRRPARARSPPLLSHSGTLLGPGGADKSDALASAFRHEFRADVGGCDHRAAARPRVSHKGRTDDLFCFADVEPQYAHDGGDVEGDADRDEKTAEAIAEQEPPWTLNRHALLSREGTRRGKRALLGRGRVR
ncbi:hypothetical protein H2203_003051 [Taxawa tesnikishii (nom. ined.)]|nr:hypothetical protein H2203_003051 [Dothideales sp. JES 119]